VKNLYLHTSEAGIAHYMVLDDNGGFVGFRAIGETDPIIEQNKAEALHNDGYTADRTMRRAARIPFIIGHKWLNEEGWWFMHAGHDPDVAKKLTAKLNSSEYMYLRTADGQLGVSNGVIR
jgi:hypothetical protein